MRSLDQPFTGEIEQSADAITGTSDIPVKRAAIRWKIEGVPALRNVVFQPSPFTAVLDTWVLLYQMSDYFESGPGRDEFGPAADQAVDTYLRMENEFSQIVTAFTAAHDVTKVRVFVSTLSRATGQDIRLKWTTGDVINEVETTVDDINREMQIYTDHLFRQANWEADLLTLNFPSSESLDLAARAV